MIVLAKEGQSIIDIVLQFTGSLDNVQHIIAANPGFTLETYPGSGTQVIIPDRFITQTAVLAEIRRRSIIIQSNDQMGVAPSPAPAIDPDAQAYINALAAAGYLVTPTEETAINTFVLSLKADGIWAKNKAIYPFIGGTGAAHKFNLKDPSDLDASFRLTFFGGWTHSATGSKPNGINAYADTHFNPSVEMALNDGSLSLYSRTEIAKGFDAGLCANDGNFVQCSPNINGFGLGFLSYIGGPDLSSINVSNTDARGFYVASRISLTSFKSYKNASISGTNTSAGPHTLPNIDLWISANQAGGGSNWSILEVAFASVGDGLTDSEVSNYYNAVQDLQIALGRNV